MNCRLFIHILIIEKPTLSMSGFYNRLIRLLFVPFLETFRSTRITPGTSCLFRNHTVSFKSVCIRCPILLHFIIIIPLSGSLKILYSLSESQENLLNKIQTIIHKILSFFYRHFIPFLFTLNSHL